LLILAFYASDTSMYQAIRLYISNWIFLRVGCSVGFYFYVAIKLIRKHAGWFKKCTPMCSCNVAVVSELNAVGSVFASTHMRKHRGGSLGLSHVIFLPIFLHFSSLHKHHWRCLGLSPITHRGAFGSGRRPETFCFWVSFAG